ncbi:hypothetical protein BCR33DRAFT_721869 [Rhizoclosmatium globosum]|uniref:C2H2-type domain-containing protein n=1 Tax=Rhizoclosmatium globosum TaxID=329046 RepID=A0A1Y2BPI0_9FUNG|nr:hypothetical protein BCR33DRAFT_721869 [Rhizoclosmatium globosum]|eukprot:ORY36651.1 hypothetical protein BCR33DRAFT_721869 [Rhizoclosmatium globosum]
MRINDLCDNTPEPSLDTPPLSGIINGITPPSPFGLQGLYLNSPHQGPYIATTPVLVGSASHLPPPGFHLVLVPCSASGCQCGNHHHRPVVSAVQTPPIIPSSTFTSPAMIPQYHQRSASLSTLAETALSPTTLSQHQQISANHNTELQRLTFDKIVRQSQNESHQLHTPQSEFYESDGTSNIQQSGKRRGSSDASFTMPPPAPQAPRPTSASSTHNTTTFRINTSTTALATAAETSTQGSSDRKYPCPFYGQPKTRKSRTGNVETSPTPFAHDEICQARFRRRQEMERHVLSVHGSEQDKGWVCPVRTCGKRYARADALRKHLDSAKSRGNVGGCSFGLSEIEIVGMVKRGAVVGERRLSLY